MRIEDFQTHFNGHVPGLLGAGSAYAVLVPLVRRRGAAHLLFEASLARCVFPAAA